MHTPRSSIIPLLIFFAHTATTQPLTLPPLPTLACINPSHVRIAGDAIEFLARLTFHPASFDPTAVDLCGSFNGHQLCHLLASNNANRSTMLLSDPTTATVDFTWSLTGFQSSPQHTYHLWITTSTTTTDNTAGTSSLPLIACDSTFETVHFPGWDNYVQSFDNTSQTIQALREQPESLSRVGHLNFSIDSFER